LQQHNDDFICVDRSEIVDYVTTSGTLGSPVTFALSDADLERLAYNEAISFACAGVKKGSVLQLMTTIDKRFMAGLAYFLGIRKLGAGIVRVGPGVPQLQWDSILKFQPDCLIVVPSFLLKLIAYAEAHGIDYKNSSVKGAICIGEALRTQDFELNTLGKKIKNLWTIDLFSTYASTEMSTAFTECEQQQGGHHHPELIIIEILDEQNQPVSDGEVGELTITTLGLEAMPLLRFKTGDRVKAHNTPCACGRTTTRLGPVVGRTQQMIKYKGTTLYPPSIHDALNHFSEIETYIIELYKNEWETDEVVIKIGTQQNSEELSQRIKAHFKAKLRVVPAIEFCAIAEINQLKFPKMSRKPVTLFDKRE
jgi:phenylacetate-CoA ligase